MKAEINRSNNIWKASIDDVSDHANFGLPLKAGLRVGEGVSLRVDEVEHEMPVDGLARLLGYQITPANRLMVFDGYAWSSRVCCSRGAVAYTTIDKIDTHQRRN